MTIYKAYIEYTSGSSGEFTRECIKETSSQEDAIQACITELSDRDEFERACEEDECREALMLRGYWTVPYVEVTVMVEEEEEDEPTTFI